MSLAPEKLRHAYARMRLIREFEERLHLEVATGTVPGFSHLSAGQEAVAVGVCENLLPGDYISSTHRGHGHCLANGSDPRRVMAEIYGRRDGLCCGKGGSMHLIDIERGFIGANGIVGAGLPLAAGAALAHRTLKRNSIAVAFAGDGASNQGAVFETLNFAVVLKLPILFVFENNGFSQFTSAEYGLGCGDLLARVRAFGMPGTRVDGVDFFAVYEAVAEAVRRMRGGGGPSVIEATLPRFLGHYEGDPQPYRLRQEIAAERAERDCLARLRERVLREGLLSEALLADLDAQALDTVDQAVLFAKSSALPDLADEVASNVYVSY
jgi:pyruvate dehydrogenase E1 component alpha subunit